MSLRFGEGKDKSDLLNDPQIIPCRPLAGGDDEYTTQEDIAAYAMPDKNGFDNTTDSEMSFVDGTRTFTIAVKAPATSYVYFCAGMKYTVTASDSIVISDVEGLHVIYYDGDTLVDVANPTDAQVDVVIRTKAILAYVYWDTTNSESSYFGEERHGNVMDPMTHSYLHFTRGAQFLSGLGLGDILADEDGNLDTHAQFSVESGLTTDEDLITFSTAIGATVGLPIYYLDGANGDMRRMTNSGFSVVTAGTGRLAYNEWTGSAWQLTEVANNDFVLCHVLQVNGYSGRDKQIAVVGQEDYATVGQARLGAATEIASILSGLPLEEAVPLGTVIFQTGNTYSNAVKGKVRSDDDGNNYVDWRSTELAQGTPASSHSNLTNLGNDDHTQYSLISSQAGAPTTTPSRVGLTNIDITNGNTYVSTGTTSSADWTQTNAGGGGSGANNDILPPFKLDVASGVLPNGIYDWGRIDTAYGTSEYKITVDVAVLPTGSARTFNVLVNGKEVTDSIFPSYTPLSVGVSETPETDGRYLVEKTSIAIALSAGDFLAVSLGGGSSSLTAGDIVSIKKV